MSPLRIYADFNGLVAGPSNSSRTAVVLDTMGSLRDLCNAGVVLREGLPLIAVDWSDELEDLEGHGLTKFDVIRGWWVVEFDEMGTRYVPAGVRAEVVTFRCVECSLDLADQIKASGLHMDTRCARCGTLVHSPLAPPKHESTTEGG